MAVVYIYYALQESPLPALYLYLLTDKQVQSPTLSKSIDLIWQAAHVIYIRFSQPFYRLRRMHQPCKLRESPSWDGRSHSRQLCRPQGGYFSMACPPNHVAVIGAGNRNAIILL